MIKTKDKKSQRRKIKVRSKIFGTNQRPRLSIFRSNKYIYAQIINDSKGQTLVTVTEKGLLSKKSKSHSPNKIDKAKLLGKLIAQKALKKNIKKVVFDRGPYRYHGRVKALAEAARKEGLKF